jgi:hypothetical protein
MAAAIEVYCHAPQSRFPLWLYHSAPARVLTGTQDEHDGGIDDEDVRV